MSIDKILEDELEWSVKNNKTVRFHAIKQAIYSLLASKTVTVTNKFDDGVDYEIFNALPLTTIKQLFGRGE